MRVHIDLAEELEVAEWTARHARGEVPDVLPYGVDKLTRYGVTPVMRQPLRNPAGIWFASKVRGRLADVDFVSSARWALRSERRTADAVLCWDERTGIPAALLPGSPPVFWSPCWLNDPAKVPPRIKKLVPPALKRAAGLFHFCEAMGPELERAWNLPRGRVHRVRMGCDEAFFRPTTYPESGGTIMSVGDDRDRDHALLVRTVDALIRGGVPARLELATQLPVEVPEHVGIVHRRRMEGSILDMFSRAAVVALAIRPGTGGSGLTAMIESMSCGRPVVVSSSIGIEDYVEDGVTGLIVPAGDERAFQHAIASILADPKAAAEMGRAGRRRVEENFTTGHLASDLADMFKKLA